MTARGRGRGGVRGGRGAYRGKFLLLGNDASAANSYCDTIGRGGFDSGEGRGRGSPYRGGYRGRGRGYTPY